MATKRPLPADWQLGSLLFYCPVCGTSDTRPQEAGPGGHRRRCLTCGLTFVIPRAQLRPNTTPGKIVRRTLRPRYAPGGNVATQDESPESYGLRP